MRSPRATLRQTSCGTLAIEARQTAAESVEVVCQGFNSPVEPGEQVTITYAIQNTSSTFPVSLRVAALLGGSRVATSPSRTLAVGEIESGLTLSFIAPEPGGRDVNLSLEAIEAVFAGDAPAEARQPVRADGGVEMSGCGCSHQPATAREALARVGRRT